MCLSVSTHMWMQVLGGSQKIRAPGTAVTDSCGPSHVSTGTWTQVLCKIRMCSQLLYPTAPSFLGTRISHSSSWLQTQCIAMDDPERLPLLPKSWDYKYMLLHLLYGTPEIGLGVLYMLGTYSISWTTSPTSSFLCRDAHMCPSV